MNKQCEIVQDLLPLYVDGACSGSSAELIEEHLKSCDTCKQIYQTMKSHTNEDILQKERNTIINHHAKRENQKVFRYLFYALATLYIPCLFLLPLFSDGSDGGFLPITYEFMLAFLFLYTFPTYLAIVELGLSVCRAFDARKRPVGEKIFNTIGILLSTGILLTLNNLETYLVPSLVLGGLLILNWILTAIVYKKKPTLLIIFKQRIFWVCLGSIVAVILAVMLIMSGFTFFERPQEQPQPTMASYSAGYRDFGSDIEGIYIADNIEELHSWDLVGQNPYIAVRFKNETDTAFTYTGFDIEIYADDQWVSCVVGTPLEIEKTFTIPADSTEVLTYRVDGFNLTNDGLYRFIIRSDDSKEVWFTFALSYEI